MNDKQMKTTEQKIRECAKELCKYVYKEIQDGRKLIYEVEAQEILTRHFGQSEQPDKSLEEIVEKWFPKHKGAQYLCTQACIEYAATKEKNAQKLCNNLAGVLNAADGDDLIAIVETIIKQRDDAMANQDPHYYFKVHEVGRPLPIDTEILLDDGRWVEACSWPQYDATKNYQARVKKGAK